MMLDVANTVTKYLRFKRGDTIAGCVEGLCARSAQGTKHPFKNS